MSIDADITQQQCTTLGGTYAESVQWMLRAWTAAKWENPSGTFAAENPRLTCIVDTYRDWIDTTIVAHRGELRDAETERLRQLLGRLAGPPRTPLGCERPARNFRRAVRGPD